MLPIARNEVLGIAAYEEIRPHFRSRVIQLKKSRRVALGGIMTAIFENPSGAPSEANARDATGLATVASWSHSKR